MKQTLKNVVNKAKQAVKSIISPNNFIIVSVDDEVYQITKNDKNYAKVESLVNRKKWDEVFNILGAGKNIKIYTEGNIKVEGDQVYYKDILVNNYVGEKLVRMIQEGNSDFQPLARFLEKLMQSEYDHVKDHLYKFLEYGNIPITPEGNFLGYKSVQKNYKDVHTGKFDNTPGNIVKMPRNQVISNPFEACSSGLHVGVKQYVDGFSGDRTVIVSVDPRNVISVPYDYSHQKMRTCEYFVVADFDPLEPLTSEVYQVTPDRKIKKYIAEGVKSLRGKDGRFIKKSIRKRNKNGRFISKK